MLLTLYKFTQRKNSTKQPTTLAVTNPYLNVEGVFNYSCDIDTPEFRITVPAEAKLRIFDYNYIVVSNWYRTYFIDRWSFDNGFAIAYCKCDLCGTFRKNIFNAKIMVSRMQHLNGSTALHGTLLNDSMYPASPYMEVETVEFSASNMFSANPSSGVFVISVLSTDAPEYGAVNYYILTSAQFATLVSNMVANSSTSSSASDAWKTTDLSSQMLKSIVNPMQYITSCRWLPLKIASTTYPAVSNIKLGPWNSGASGHKITADAAPEVSAWGELQLPAVPADVVTAGLTDMHCLSFPPYATYTLFNALFGTYEIDGNAVTAVRRVFANSIINPFLEMRMRANVITGTCMFRLYAPTQARHADNDNEGVNANLLFQIDRPTFADIPLADISTNYVEMGKSTLSAVGGAAGGITSAITGNVAGAVSGFAGALSSGIDVLKYSMSPEVKSNAVSGGKGFYSNIHKFIFQGVYYRTVKTDYDETGRATSYNGNIHDIIFPESATSISSLIPTYILPSFIDIPMTLVSTSVFPNIS